MRAAGPLPAAATLCLAGPVDHALEGVAREMEWEPDTLNGVGVGAWVRQPLQFGGGT